MMKNKKKNILVWVAGGFLLVAGLAYRIWPEYSVQKVCRAEHCYLLELADTPEERAQGLMYRPSLASGHGMLFVFDTGSVRAFWMKNTLIPLDILWIDEHYRIQDIQSASPCTQHICKTYVPSHQARWVVELP